MTSMTSTQISAAQPGSGQEPSPPGSLAAKLQVPQPDSRFVCRRRVIALIDDAARHRVTLVCAPPRAGKTVACASWARDSQTAARIVWVTAGPEDAREWFWAYVCAGLRQAGVRPAEVIQPLEDVSAAAFPLRLVAAAQAFSEPVVLVLDNVHEVTDDAVLNGLAFVIHHAPAALRLVLSGRGMPAGLQLARLPISDLACIGVRELACTADEADVFLARLGIEADAAERDDLLRRADGCMADLRLAVASGG
jgi:LuxR family transcriptional regulator, maltose regulon positive regulatory protein